MRVLLVEDEPWVRDDVAALLSRSDEVQRVAACASIAETVERIRGGLDVDVGLIDLGLPDGRGVDLIAWLRDQRPGATLLAFTVHEDAPTVFDALRAGARGYLLKSTPPSRLVPSLAEAMQGGAPLSPTIARMIIDQLALGGRDAPSASLGADEPAAGELTKREREVLALLAKGIAYADVGTALGIALGTVQAHVRNIYGKLEIGSKAEAAVIAAKLGLV